MSNFHNAHVDAATTFGGKGVEISVKGDKETVNVILQIDENGEIVMHKHVKHNNRSHS